MKTILLTLSSLLLTLSAHAQGTVVFANTSSTAVTNLVTGDRLVAGPTFLAQLYYGPADAASDASLVSMTNAPINFFLPGLFNGGTRSLALPGGSTGTFQVRVWEAVLGADWDTAFMNSMVGPYYGNLGKSRLFQVVVGDPYGSPPTAPAPIVPIVGVGFQGFYVGMPEPSTFALGALGVAVLLWRRRRTT